MSHYRSTQPIRVFKHNKTGITMASTMTNRIVLFRGKPVTSIGECFTNMGKRYCIMGFLVCTVYVLIICITLSPESNINFLVTSANTIKQKTTHSVNDKFDGKDVVSFSKPDLYTHNNCCVRADVNDYKTVATSASSKIYLTFNRSKYPLGEMIHVRIELCDGYGKHISIGGDVLRIWMTGLSQNASVNGYVTDHANGSYTGHVMALWTGESVIKTSIANTKQQISLVQNHIEKHGQVYAMLGGFGKHDKVVEKTTCSVKPDVYGLTDMCNLTKANYDNELYCGRPTNPNLTCTDWITMHDIITHDINPNEIKNVRPFVHQPLKSLVVNITGEYGVVPSPTLPCHKRSSKDTWTGESPAGFYYRNKWQLRACNNTFVPSRKSYEDCLRNRHLLFLGDSNIRSWFWRVQQLTRSKTFANSTVFWKMAERVDLNITMTWAAHEIPYYSGLKVYFRKDIKSNAWHLDEIPPHKNVIVLIHYTYHVIRIMPRAFRAHVRSLKQGLMKLFERNLKSRVFIKGPHSSINSRLPYLPVDYARKGLEQILYEELQELQNKIVYLNGWDLTTGIENINLHPSDKTVNDMVHDLFGYLCRS